jgi:hypothetical protein
MIIARETINGGTTLATVHLHYAGFALLLLLCLRR